MRLLLGLSLQEAGLLLGGLTPDTVKNLERTRAGHFYEQHLSMLEVLLARTNEMIDDALDAPRTDFLITYPNDDAFRNYEPDLVKWMRFNSMHLMFVARLRDELMREGASPEVMELVPIEYDKFRSAQGTIDDAGMRQIWAANRRSKIEPRPGWPHPKKRRDTGHNCA